MICDLHSEITTGATLFVMGGMVLSMIMGAAFGYFLRGQL